jgi:hypothetical protein
MYYALDGITFHQTIHQSKLLGGTVAYA